jgi:hypothetical protein
MVAPEAIGPLQRYAALVAEVPVIRLAEPLARELGLREGQIVQASLDMQSDGVALKLNERLFMLPPGWQRYANGDMRWFQFVRQGGGVGLKMLPPGAQPGVSSAGSMASAGAMPPTSPLGGAPSSAVGTPASATGAAATSSARLAELLGRPASFDSLFNALRPGGLESLLSAQPGGQALASALAALRLRVDYLSAQAIQQSILMSGMWSESLLASGRLNPGNDLKVLLRQALRLLGPRSAQSEELSSALDAIERKQVETLQAQNDQRMVFSVLLPFADAEPALLRFEREPRRSAKAPQRYVIDFHLKPGALGDLWIKTGVVASSVDVTVWTPRADIASLVGQFKDELAFELSEAGLQLQRFDVVEGARPDLPEQSVVPPALGVFDMKV